MDVGRSGRGGERAELVSPAVGTDGASERFGEGMGGGGGKHLFSTYAGRRTVNDTFIIQRDSFPLNWHNWGRGEQSSSVVDSAEKGRGG